ncbi:MAG TPA: CocE/NonD family hydrolase [Blastocatellia bacterium]|nr:CocE/NonD family hydrolase [Blastocatellia bacterium]
MKPKKPILLCWLICAVCLSAADLSPKAQHAAHVNVKERYHKTEYQIPMRDGKRLFTVVYAPKETAERHPILMTRSPYGSGPYGSDSYRSSLGPSPLFMQEDYIFVYQDVRGTFMSEGEFEDVRPYLPRKKSPREIDEASDTYDTIEWLINNVPNHNGRVGIWGISYPGFYAAMSLLDSHPALKAVSPQAPISDWFIGDDDHHNGAFFLFDCFGFNMFFGMPRPHPTANQFKTFDYGVSNAYQFFLDLGSVANAQKKYFKGQNKYWNDVMSHGTYDEFWQARSLLPHLKKTTPAVMIVGGWFDAEDLYGPLHIYQALEKNNQQTQNLLVVGPWAHGGWARGAGDSLGKVRFDLRTAEQFRQNMELPFFNANLKDQGPAKLPEATVFRTGANTWQSLEHWPPVERQTRALYFHKNGKLSFEQPRELGESFDEYISDPHKPVPYTSEVGTERGTGYMIEDQRFAYGRPDVLAYATESLTEDVTLSGPMVADLFVSTTGTDADFIVKLIDVFPEEKVHNLKPGGFQMLVRAEVMRGKFRKSFSKPEPFTPGKPAEVKFDLQDINHTFKAGHRIMVQVQSSWFPLVDRNPQKFVDIYHASESDFQKATHRIYTSSKQSSRLQVGVLK